MSIMLLAIDIGNTTMHVGVFKGQELCAIWRLATDVHKMADEYAVLLLGLLSQQGLKPSDIKHAVICSVTPPLMPTFRELCQHYFNVSPFLVEAGVKTGVNILMDNPREVGADRIANAVAGYHLYGGPLIIVDLGTATTFDVVSEKGDYLGGAIAPGIKIATEALFQRTAKLPRVDLVRPKHVIGRDTVSAMQSGIIFGYVGLIEGLVSRIRQELGGKKARVIATGGYAELLARETKVIEIVDPHLTLVGLRIIHELNPIHRGDR
ncbi:MAG: Type III pantothenate kinase [Dehalococcoidia bacterium]|nr:Type III pantothenate kinase [Chloroflexota bacterium]MBT9160172.1 Type III pantothenate kinase [Chloroflexota bacterium]MBT9162174.1 Type III pantothenate kinase [Chloroflexota bacterium]